MGERTGGLDVTSYDGHKAQPASPGEAVRQLGADIAALREDLSGLVAELDNRRHDMLDLKLQARRHAVGVTVTAATLLGAAAGVVWVGIWRARRRRTLLSRAARFREAVGRMVDQPDRVAAEQSVLGKIVTAAATAAVATMIKRLVGPATQTLVDRYQQAGTAGRRERRERAAPLPVAE
jgi:hypothetical protein